MALLLTGTQDQALLSRVVHEAVTAAGGAVPVAALPQVMYFLLVKGVPMRYRFDIQGHGALCEDVLKDVNRLAADGILELSQEGGEALVHAQATRRELENEHTTFLEEHGETVQFTVSTLQSYRRDDLEVLAWVDFACRWIRGKAQTPGLADVAKRLDGVALPKDALSLEEAFAKLRAVGLIEV